MGCNHLTATERESILYLRAQGYGIRKIAGALNRSPSTISRELRRNLVPIASKDLLFPPREALYL